MAQTPNLGLPLIDENMTADVPRDMNALANAVDTAVKDAVDGVTVPDATTTQKGIVQLNDTTTSTNKTQAGTADAVRRAYDRGTEGVNAAAAAQAKADAAETPAGAQAKANAAETNAKNASLPRTGGTLTGDLSIKKGSIPTLILDAGRTNVSKLWWNASPTVVDSVRLDVDGATVMRWTPEKTVEFLDADGQWDTLQNLKSSVANGKQAIATAISGKGIVASGSDEFAVLANKISQIPVGVKYAYGSVGNMDGNSTRDVDCGFTPKVIIISGVQDGTAGVRRSSMKYSTTQGSAISGSYNSVDFFTITSNVQQVFRIATTSSVIFTDVRWEAWA